MLNQDIKSSSEFLNDKINSNQLELKKDIKTFYDSINKEFDLKHKEIYEKINDLNKMIIILIGLIFFMFIVLILILSIS